MDYLKELIRVLGVEKRLYTELTELAEKKQKIIIANDIDGLVKCLEDEQELVASIEDVERERRQAVIGLGVAYDFSDKEISYSKLCGLLDQPSRVILAKFRDSLLEVLERLQQINDTNRVLIEEALKINDFTVRLITQAANPQTPIYSKDGVDKNKSKHLIDKRA